MGRNDRWWRFVIGREVNKGGEKCKETGIKKKIEDERRIWLKIIPVFYEGKIIKNKQNNLRTKKKENAKTKEKKHVKRRRKKKKERQGREREEANS